MEDKKKILIIDDDEFLLDMYLLKFKEVGFDVEVAFSAKDALEKIRAGLKPDIILLDILMSGMNGYEFLDTVKNENLLKDSKILILSNLGQKEDIEKALAKGAQDYIIKAYFTPSEIIKKVKALL